MKPNGLDNAAACSLSQGDGSKRRERWLRLCERALAGKAPTERGVRLRFRALDGVASELRELAALERECCSFAMWSVRSDYTNLILDVRAKGDAADVVRALFEELPATHTDVTAHR
ncbi:MAG: hypothetical protein M3065_02760 [Actinomycetota bacterium]|nr:hypothetical protein [Actinomycetota bacterium]